MFVSEWLGMKMEFLGWFFSRCDTLMLIAFLHLTSREYMLDTSYDPARAKCKFRSQHKNCELLRSGNGPEEFSDDTVSRS